MVRRRSGMLLLRRRGCVKEQGEGARGLHAGALGLLRAAGRDGREYSRAQGSWAARWPEVPRLALGLLLSGNCPQIRVSMGLRLAVAVMLGEKARPRGCVEGKIGWGRRERAGRAHLDGERQATCTATAAIRAAVRRGEERDRGEAAVGENYAGIVARKLGDGRKKLRVWRFQEDKQGRLLTRGPWLGSGGGGGRPPRAGRGRACWPLGRGAQELGRAAASARALRVGRDAHGPAREGVGAVGRAGGGGGEERGRAGRGWAGRNGPGKGSGSLFLFSFLSLFYLFQFDFMCK
jgi:hypothetical protein